MSANICTEGVAMAATTAPPVTAAAAATAPAESRYAGCCASKWR
eukprot:CAMPEP_0181394094 /NCGR_PEP_ID=MMETSP1106-20121128/27580_1 /TAXON_ID=81844 /ORGANISM="Mantoniella antarctica, Strain SL-175" /LENGTH=43 /DNA_ID= /DNA_START= /DNA_END= /DNA_ORIENTATION=